MERSVFVLDISISIFPLLTQLQYYLNPTKQYKTKRTSQMLVREFLQARTSEQYSNAYGRGVFEICLGIINEDERYKGMYDFACWYRDLLQKEGHSL